MARELVTLLYPPSGESGEVRAMTELFRGIAGRGLIASLGDVDEKQFAISLETGAKAALPNAHAALAARYTKGMSEAQLQAALAFYGSKEGQAALRRRRHFAELSLDSMEHLQRGEESPKKIERELEHASLTAPDMAFRATAPGQAMSKAEMPSSSVALTDAIKAAETDYCGRLACDARIHRLFLYLTDVVIELDKEPLPPPP